jgi:hypothetical protein
MRKAPFSGITALDPNESIYSDNSAFVDRDRMEIDRELKIGVKTHRHDGRLGLAAPVHAPSGLVIGSGGSIPAGISLTLGLTYQDAQGGETLLGPTQLVTTPSPVQSPTTQLTAVADYTAGSLTVDTYTYAFTYLDGQGGETPLGAGVVVTRDPGFANARIKLEGLKPGGTHPDASIVAARVYRARAGGEYVHLADVTANAYFDDGSVSPDCDAHPPSFNLNTTGGTNQLVVTLGAVESQAPEEVERAFINLYCSQSGTFDESCLVGRYPTGSAAATAFVTSLSLLEGQPPDVNRSFGGADKIDPDTELLDWHWKRPVATAADLPAGEEGDARITLDTGVVWTYGGGEWREGTAGGGEGGGGSAGIDVRVKPPTTTIADSFDSGELDSHWELSGGGEPMSSWWTEEAGFIKKPGGGAPGFRNGAEGTDGTVMSKFGGEASFACMNLHILDIGGTEEIRVGYEGGLGHGNPAKLVIKLYGTAAGSWSLASTSFTEPAVGDYYVVSTFDGTVIKCAFYDVNPEEVGATPLHTVEVDLASGSLEPSAEELAPFIGRSSGRFGLMFVGAPGGKTYEWIAQVSAATELVDAATFIEFRQSGEDLTVSASGPGAVVTLPKVGGGSVPEFAAARPLTLSGGYDEELDAFVEEYGLSNAMGHINCGENLAQPRPEGYDCVTWMTEGQGEAAPENMAEKDLLIAINGEAAKQFIKIGAGLVAL